MSTTPDQVFGALAPGAQLLEYRIESVLGHGGFGITYLAHDTHLDAQFAIKEFLPPDLAARDAGDSVSVRSEAMRESFEWARDKFLNEARVLARFSHPNLVRVNRFFTANGTVYFVMEFVQGRTLGQLLKAEPNLPESRIREIVSPLASGLAQVHDAGVLHRDIKPGNIIIREDGTPVLIDFGAARQSFGSATRSLLNVVSAGYAPIEQYSEGMPQGPYTDIYALGAVCYRMLTGKKPPDAVSRLRQDPVPLALQHCEERAGSELRNAVDWAMAIHPEDRPQSLTEWQEALAGQRSRPQADPARAVELESLALATPRQAPDKPPSAHTEILSAVEPLEHTELLPPASSRRELSASNKWLALWRSKPWPVWLGIGTAAITLAAVLWMLRPLDDGGPEPDNAAVAPEPTSAPATHSSNGNFVELGAQRIAAGERDAVAADVQARLAADDRDGAARALLGHLAFVDGRREDGIAEYTRALNTRPDLAGTAVVARDLVGSLGWATAPAEALIKTYPSEAMLAALAERTGAAGPHGRGHAFRILTELGHPERIDTVEFAKRELAERHSCEAKIIAIRMLRDAGDPSVIPLLKAQIPNWYTSRCLRDDIKDAIATLEKTR